MAAALPDLAKPSGILLAEHTANVMAQAIAILNAYPFLERKYRRIAGKDLRAEVLAACQDHDLGKATEAWQVACRKDYEAYQAWRTTRGLDRYGVSPGDYATFETEVYERKADKPSHLMRSGLRHEIASLPQMRGRSHVVFAAVAAHHGKLSERYRKRWDTDAPDFAKKKAGAYAAWFSKFEQAADAYTMRHEIGVNEVLRKRYKYDGVRALLQFADTRASRKESLGEKALAPLEPWSFSWPQEWQDEEGRPLYRPVQREALATAEGDNMVSILRAPTGSGKTAASLLWADRHISRGRADRLVVAMPTRFTANALAKATEDMTDAPGLYHSTAFYNQYGELRDADKRQAKELHLMAQRLATPVTVCTVDHILMALTGSREAHHSTFFFLANAAVVFDEADFYDPFVQANLKFLLDGLRALEVPVLIMSATVPESARHYYEVSALIVDVDKAEAAERTPPVRKVRYGGEVATPSDQAEVLRKMLLNGRGIVYANTVARAMAYWQYLTELQEELDPEREVDIVLYHSRFTEPHKKDKEQKLLAILGREAVVQGKTKGIAVLTQIGEMSINISTHLMLCEACPWDRLSQRIGRLNRFGESLNAECIVVKPMKDGKLYPAPYGEYIRRQGWQESKPLASTVAHLEKEFAQGKTVTPVEMTTYVNTLYPTIEEPTAAARQNISDYDLVIRHSALVLPNIKSDDENATAFNWAARQIGPQATVLTRAPTRLKSFEAWQEYKLTYGLEVPAYEVERDQDDKHGKKRLTKTTVQIGFQDTPEVITYYYAVPEDVEDEFIIAGGRSVYSADLGLHGLYELSQSTSALMNDEDD